MGVAAVTFVATMFTSCMESKEAHRLFADVEAVIEDHPDSALALLDSAYEASRDYPKSQRMRYNLLLTEAKNKAYVTIDNDSVMQEVVQYYDSHGTANERVHAHYLLGCSYRDMGESPQALNSFYDAIATSDTLSADCDWDLMMRVWGQIADVLNDQVMPMEYLEANQQYTKCAEKAHDEYEKIRGIELQVKAYSIMRDTAMVIDITDSVYYLYEKLGMHTAATNALFAKIDCLIGQNKLDEAHRLMMLYEKESDAFNDNGEIEPRRNAYFLLSGEYYLKREKYAQAIQEYNKVYSEIAESNVYYGIMKAYEGLNISDSVLRYANLYQDAINNSISHLYYDSNKKVLALYNYNRQTRIAQEKEKEAERSKHIIIIISVFAFVILCTLYIIYRKHMAKRASTFAALNQNYLQALKEYDKQKEVLEHIDKDHQDYIKQKESEIADLKSTLKEYEQKYRMLKRKDRPESIKQSDIFKKLNKALTPSPNSTGIQNTDLQELTLLLQQSMPTFFSTVIEEGGLSSQEQHVAMLTILGFSTTDISILLDKSKQNINNSKTKINKKLFGEESAKTLFTNLKSIDS